MGQKIDDGSLVIKQIFEELITLPPGQKVEGIVNRPVCLFVHAHNSKVYIRYGSYFHTRWGLPVTWTSSKMVDTGAGFKKSPSERTSFSKGR